MTNFEQNLEKLERLTADIKRSDVSLEEALKDFEQGIKLARTMEKEIDKIEGRIQQLMNNPMADAPVTADKAELGLFSGLVDDGSAGEPLAGTRQ